ncbi:MAG: metallophosphoesterase [Saprospiraceae bacterium]|nr:metallophosphoesterase [Saprospiraceae bacterium]
MELIERQEKINFFGGKENFSIIHISDIHLWYSTRILKKIKAIIFSNNPDLIFLTGDYYDIPKGAYNFREFLCDISQAYTIIFIKGNHDTIYGTKISNLLLGIQNCFSVENELFIYKSKQGNTYNITSWRNKQNLPNNKTETNIVLIHNPEKINTKELTNIQLILAGHLHGGQFIFFKTKKNSNFPGCLLYKHCVDRKQILNTTIVVSKGLGDTFPFRLNCSREIVKIIIE